MILIPFDTKLIGGPLDGMTVTLLMRGGEVSDLLALETEKDRVAYYRRDAEGWYTFAVWGKPGDVPLLPMPVCMKCFAITTAVCGWHRCESCGAHVRKVTK